MKTATTLSLQPFVFLGSPALLAPAFAFGLADEVPDLGGDAFAFGRAHACRVPGNRLGRLCHFLAQFGAAHLGLGIEVGHPGHLNEFFLRRLEARDWIALPGFRFPRLATFFRLPLALRLFSLLSLHRRFLLYALGARHQARSAGRNRGWSPWAARGRAFP